MSLIKRFLIPLLVFIGVAALFPSIAHADEVPPPPVTLDAEAVSTITLAAPIVSIIVGILIPLLNGFFTRLSTSSGIKALLTLALSLISAIITNGLLADGSAVFTTTTLYTALGTWGVAFLTYNQLYKPLGVTSSNAPNGEPGKLANVGRHD